MIHPHINLELPRINSDILLYLERTKQITPEHCKAQMLDTTGKLKLELIK